MLYTESFYTNIGLGEIYHSVMEGIRLTPEQGIQLLEHKNIQAIGALAHHVRTRMHGANTYCVRNMHLNYSNVCVHPCTFCAFKRSSERSEGAFIYSHEELLHQLDQEGAQFAEIHIVGGCHPTLSLDWFTSLVGKIRAVQPHADIKMFTAVEIDHLAQLENTTIEEVLRALKEAGATMLTGGGAEIFAPRVRKKICPTKLNAEEWLHVHRTAHAMGYLTNCTMLFGHIETLEERIHHLCCLRELQDESKGFICFIPLAFQRKNNPLGATLKTTDSYIDRMKTIAVSRLMLDNIPHIKAYWIMLGVKEAQMALYFGADDIDGTIVEEKIGHWAGAQSSNALHIDELRFMITQSGFTPIYRNARFLTA